ncbi:Ig-like domain-containing protein [Shewanella sp. ANA-3]|uniref:Ig-like domain-containing protein n=1 Tax=Shewanella sp. (strain ANA-3) TaxID=94122 RepID=UPI0003115090|nr:Ig-like domain-containing protein [Shewanella sp. ANA-3]
MGSIITTKKGLLKLVKGQIEVEVNGSNQPAKDGEQLPKGAVLHIGENATYEITFDDGTKLSNEVEPSIAATPNAGGQATQDEIQALQDLIASGEDPTQNLPETAAGNAPAGRDGNSGYVTLARDGTEALATSGYSTSGQTLTAATTAAPEQTVATDSPSVLVNDSITVDEDTVASGNVLDNDSDADNVLSVVGFNINGTDFAAGTVVTLEGGSFILNADGSYSFTPNENWNGQVPVITYTTNTGSTATLTINVTPVDDPSVLANDTNTVDEDTIATGNVLDNDTDVDSSLSVVSFTVSGSTFAAGTTVALEGGSLLLNADGSYSFTPNENWNGQVPVITYTTNTGSTATLTINVTPVDDPSVLANDTNTVAEDTVATGNVLDNDTDVDSSLSVVSFTVSGSTFAAGTTVALEGGSLVLNADGSYSFTPNENWNGQVPVITYTTNTGSTATLTINVTPVDDPSVLANDTNTVAEDTVATGNVLDNDTDVDSSLSVVSFTVSGSTFAAGTTVTLEGGSLVLNADGSYSFTPNENWNGQVPVITYTTNTGSTATLTINITPVADGAPSVTITTDTNDDGFISNAELGGATEVSVTIGLGGTGANAGDTLTVNGVDYVLTQEDINNGYVNLTLPAPAEGETITVVATITDPAGNTSPEGSDSALLDTTAPTITVSAPDDTRDTTPTITGTTDAAPGSVITIVVTDSNGVQQTLTTTVNPDGTYAVDVINPIPHGGYTATATVTDPAGNTGNATDNGNVDIKIDEDGDGNTVAITSITQDTGSSSSDFITNDNTLVFHGTVDLDDNSTLAVTINGVTYTTANGLVIDAQGNWSVDLTGTVLPDGTYPVVATVTDVAGNSKTVTQDVVIDTKIDEDGDGNTVAITSITQDTGSSSSDFITNDNTLVFHGTVDLDDNSTLAVTINGVTYTTANGLVIDAQGNWSVDLTGTVLPDGTYPVVATVTDIAGNTTSATQDVIVDTQIGLGRDNAVTITSITEDTGSSNTDFITNDNTLVFQGTVELDGNSNLVVTINGVEYTIGNGLVIDANGHWSVDLTGTVLPDGTYPVVATVTDVAGNSKTVTQDVVIDTKIDEDGDGNTVAITSITQDTGSSSSDFITNDNTLVFHGTVDLDDNSTLAVTINGVTYTTANGLVIDAQGNWSVDLTGTVLPDGTYPVVATVTDVAGNSKTVTQDVVIDTKIDEDGDGNTVAITSITQDTGSSSSDFITNDNTLVFHGTVDLDDNSTLAVTINGVTYTTANGLVIDAQGNWSVDLTGTVLPDGTYPVVATVTDVAGNSKTVTQDVVIDTKIDEDGDGNTVAITSITQDTGSSSSDFITNDNTLVFHGTVDLDDNSTLAVTINGVTYTTANGLVIDAQGNWSVDLTGTVLPDGTYPVVATVTDVAGNSKTVTQDVVIDTKIDEDGDGNTVAITSITQDTGSSSSDFITNDNTLVFHGTVDLDDSSTLAVTINGVTYTTANGLVIDAQGNWSVDLTGTVLPDGTYPVVATVTDVAGNSKTVTQDVVIDTKIDEDGDGNTVAITSITQDTGSSSSDFITNDNTLVFHGTVDLDDNSTLAVTINGVTYTTANGLVIDAQGNWSVDLTGTVLPDGTYPVVATVTDVAGNSKTVTQDVVIDTAAPSATISVDNITADDILNAQEAAGNVLVTGTVGGDAAVGDTVTMVINGTTYSTQVIALVGGGLGFSVNVAGSDLAVDTEFTATVTGSDDAGNPFSASTTSTHTVDTSASATISVDNITADDILNAQEAAGNVLVTGTVGGDAAVGDTVTMVINGTTYSTQVIALVGGGLGFSVNVAGSDLAVDTEFTATVTGSDDAGNPFSASTTSTHTVDTSASATISVDNITADDILNAQEAAGNVLVTGTVGGDAAVGDTVTMVINGTTYSTQVIALVGGGLGFSVNVAGSDLAVDTEFTATVTGSDDAGNPFSASTTSTHTVDTSASATISVDNITADDILNAQEAAGNVLVTGTVGGDAAVGDTVTMVINGTTYSTQVIALVGGGLGFSVNVAGSDLAVDTEFTATVTGSDDAGNPFSASTTSTHTVDTSASATISVDNITADDILNAQEAAGNVLVTGTVGGDAAVGDTVTMVINGTTYSTQVIALVGGGLGFSVSVAGSDLAVDTEFTATVTGSDDAGNPFSASTTSTHTVDTSASATISVDNITADDILNAQEAAGNVLVTGTVGGDAAVGDTVTMVINGTTYSTQVIALVGGGLGFSVNVAGSDLAVDTEFTATVTGSDDAGNPFSASTTSTHTVDTSASATISVDNITADDILNAQEAAGNVLVTGTVGGDAAVGDTVTMVINGTTYSTQVIALVGGGLGFSVNVAGSDLAVDTEFTATVTGSDDAGNPFSASTTSTHTVDTSASATISVDNITADDILNAQEAAGNVLVTGTVGGDAAVGDTVTMVINGTTYSTQVIALVGGGLGFSVSVAGSDLAVDTEFTATVTGSDDAGNPFSASTTSTHTVDTSASATISVDNITADDILNAQEAAGNVLVTGTVGGDAAVGDTVTMVINGTTYSTQVIALVGGGLGFSVSVAGSDLAVDTEFTATVTGSDDAGNPFSASTTSTHTVDTSASATISVDNITADDILNAQEAAGNVLVTGTVGGDAAVGDTVTMVINGTTYSTQVIALVGGGLGFSVNVAGSDLAVDTEFTATVTGSDDAGNPFSASTTSTHTVDTSASATISVDNITADDILNAQEAAGNVLVTGTVGGDAAVGDTVTMVINGTTYSTQVIALVGGGLGFSVNVAGSDLTVDTEFTATVTGSDDAGNPFSASTTSTHTVDTSASATISVDNITADDILNAQEAAGNVLVTGTVGGDAAVGDTVTMVINGTTYSTQVIALVGGGLGFSVNVAGSDLAVDTEFTATVTGSDDAGNPFSASTTSTHTVDTSASATISVDNITADDILNAQEAAGNVLVTGTVGGDAAVGDTVTMVINGTTYSTQVIALVGGGLGFSVSVAGSDLAVDTEFTATVTGSDDAGNPFSASTTSTHTVDTSASATISVDNITADDILNAQEAAGNVLVTGTVGGDAAVGDTVTMVINGTTYSTQVIALVGGGLGFSVNVAGSDLAVDTEFTATVTGSDDAGNPFSASTTSTHTVDTSASATISVDNITADDILNAQEAAGNVLVTGTVGGDAAVGDTVTMVINGTTYSTQVIALVGGGLGFSVSVAGSDLAVDTEFTATVTGSDDAGNPFSASTTSTHTVDTSASATISVDNITADDILNAQEAAGNVLVTGTVGGDAAVGDTVTMVINGTTYSTQVIALVGGGLGFSVSVAGSDLAVDTEFTATVTGSDDAGNPFSASTTSTHTVDTSASATITVDNITSDDILNAQEAAGDVTVTGTVGGDAAIGDTVTMVINGTTYTTQVIALVGGGLGFSVSVAGSDLAVDTEFTATVTGSDDAGNPFSASTTSTHTVDTSASATITVDNITSDDILNAQEAAGDVTVTGTVGGDAAIGDTVTMVINGTTYTTQVIALVGGGLGFSVSVAGSDLAVDTEFTATVTGSDDAGNPFSASTTSTHTVDTSASATITVDNITSDDILNAQEAAGDVTVTGTVGGDAAIGDTVTMVINGTTYTTQVIALVGGGLGFSVNVAGSDLAVDTEFTATVTGSDDAGNPFSASTTSTHTVDTSASATITVDNITSDDILNAQEAAGDVTVTGTVGGDAAIGDTVTMVINGTTYTTQVIALVGGGLGFSVSVAGSDLAVDTEFTATVTGSDDAGNPFSASTTSTHTVDTSASATITVDNITSDDILNAQEAAGDVTVTGTVGGDAAIGDTVTMVINGTTYTTQVIALVGGGLGFSVSVAGSDLAVDTEFTATVTGSDDAGNPFSASTTSTHTVDTSASATITVDNITSDDILNAQEAAGDVTVTGTVGGDAAIGDTVTMVINGTTYTTQVIALVGGGLGFSVNVAGSDLAVDTEFTATVTGSDDAGNPFSASTTSTHTVDTSASATITVDNITSDDILNAQEAAGDVTVTGTVGGDAAIGDTVTMVINGTTYTTQVIALVGGGLGFSVNVAGSDLAVDTEFTATVTGSDDAGNPFSASTTSTHTVDTSASATITVDNITSDDILNAQEAAGDVTVTGTVGGDAAIGDTVTMVINGTTYTTQVIALVGGGLGFSVSVAGSDLAVDTEFTATVTGSDDAGNPFSASTTSTHTVDTSASATITVDNITSDDILNAQEAAGDVTVTGTVGGDAAIGDTVTMVINGTTYTTQVIALVGGGLGFSVSVAGSDLAVDTEFTATVTGSDDAGNPFSASTTSTHTVDTSASATITVDNITSDDILNAQEAAGDVTVTGTVGGDAAIGDTVTMVINGTTYTTQVIALVGGGLGFSVSVAGSDLAVDTEFTATVTGSDDAGNPFSASTTSTHTVDTSASATITVDNITSDDILNAQEAAGDVTVTGTVGGDAAIGDTVTMVINGTTYTTQVIALVGGGLGFSVSVAGSDLAVDTEFTATVTGSDDAGNPFSASTTSTHTVDTSASATITVDNITSDDILNAQEAAGDVTVTGTVGGDAAIGDTVTMVINGTTYSTQVIALVGGGLGFSVNVAGSDLAVDTEFTATVTGSDDAGNPFSASTTSTHTVDTSASATITVDNITSDDILNAQEAAGDVTVTGTVGGDAAIGDTVTMVINGTTYSTQVIALVGGGLGFSVNVAGSDLAVDTEFTATVTGSDDAGNPFSASTTSTHSVDNSAPNAPTVLIVDDGNPGDGLLTQGEINSNGAGVQLTVDINATDFSAGGHVSLTIVNAGVTTDVELTLVNGVLYANGSPTTSFSYNNGVISWTETRPADGALLKVEATQTDKAGNTSDKGSDQATVIYANDDSFTKQEDQLVTGQLLTNDHSSNTSIVSFTFMYNGTLTSFNAGQTVALSIGSLLIQANGEFKFIPNQHWSGDVPTVTYTTNTGDTATLNITVQPVADKPLVDVILTANGTPLYSGFISSGITTEQFRNGDFTHQPFNTGAKQTDASSGQDTVYGSNGNDHIVSTNGGGDHLLGYAGNDVLVGGDAIQGDTINGGTGNDILVAGLGQDSLYGGEGNDIAVLMGNRADYIITKDYRYSQWDNWFNFTTIEHGQTITKALHDIEYIQFDDGIYELDKNTGELVMVQPTYVDYPVEIHASLTDRDGSELLDSIELSGLPAGTQVFYNGQLLGVADNDGKLLLDYDGPDGWTGGNLWAENALDATLTGVTIRVPGTSAGQVDLVVEAVAREKGTDLTNSATGEDTIRLDYFKGTEGEPGDQNVNFGSEHNIVVGDLDGSIVLPGQNYNIAFMVDSSGSINADTLETMKLQLAQVLETLKDSASGQQSGTVKIFLVDFDTHAKGSISVDLSDPNALDILQDALDDMSSGGGTNYEDVFTTTANWFANGDAQNNSGATNLAFFITDGKPTYYNAVPGGNPLVYDTWGSNNDRSLSQLIGSGYVFGQVYTVNGHVVIDENGNVFSVDVFNSVSRSPVGAMRPDAQGNYQYYALAGNGRDSSADTISNSQAGFALLSSLGVTVQAIGMGSNIDEDDLLPYDSDDNVQTNVDADDLADAILGDQVNAIPGADRFDGGAGDDVIFGDAIHFTGISGQGFAAIKAYVADKLGIADASDAQVHRYISEHSDEFDQSGANDKADIILGGAGNDILFGQGGNDYLDGGAGKDTLYGGNGNDTLIGGAGNDTLIGGAGNDTLIGGLGDDVLRGDSGNDTFVWRYADADKGTDHIMDFNVSEDKLDLSDLLQGETAGTLESYLNFSLDSNGSTVIDIDANKDGVFDQHIVLDGVNLYSQYGATDNAGIINGLLGTNGNGPLIIDAAPVTPDAPQGVTPLIDPHNNGTMIP